MIGTDALTLARQIRPKKVSPIAVAHRKHDSVYAMRRRRSAPRGEGGQGEGE